MDESSSSNACFPPPKMNETAVPEKDRENSSETADSGKPRETTNDKDGIIDDKATEDKIDGKPPLDASMDEAILEKVKRMNRKG